jgi:hypothetical protein
MWAWIGFGVLNSLYSLVWDVKVDWKLNGRRRLYFPAWVYPPVVVLNTVLRFAWLWKVAYLSALIDAFIHSRPVDGSLAALVSIDAGLILAELFRRFVWVGFRLEREWPGYTEVS